MTSQTNERALEATIEKHLTGFCLEELQDEGITIETLVESREQYRSGNGFYMGASVNFNARYAVDEIRFWNFLETTQGEELAKLKKQTEWRLKILERLDRMIRKYGVLRVLRKGLDVDDAHFTMLHVLPIQSSSETIRQNFNNNQFSVTRQVPY